jgi:hypothetical protein
MARIGWFFPALFLVSTLSAQSLPPAMFVAGEQGSKTLTLSKVETRAQIFGDLAETTVTMTFTSEAAREIEGDLFFPLPEGSTVSGYALDINGIMVDGVSVPKERGRQVFEAIINWRRDPGLVEWTEGNTFKTRVYPIPARGSRTVRVSYISELSAEKDGTVYHLPLGFKQPLPEFSLRVEVAKHAVKPKVTSGGVRDLAFAEEKADFVAETRLRNARLSEDLTLLLPGKPKPQVMVELAEDGTAYFAVCDLPPIQEATEKNIEKNSAPRHVAIYWDASGSRGSSNHEREIRLLTKYFDEQIQPGGQSIRVELRPFNIAPLPTREFIFNSGDTRAEDLKKLANELEKIGYDGGTQLSAISPPQGVKPPDFYLLFSDGNATFGKLAEPKFDAPLYVLSDDAHADQAFLQQLAGTSGGRYFDLQKIGEAEVLASIGRPPYYCQTMSVRGDDVSDLYPKLPHLCGDRLLLVGKLEGQRTELTLHYGIEGKSLQKSTFTIARAEAAEGKLLRTFWAQKKLADLMISQQNNEKAIADLGREFGLVTPYTSLIVLESLAQYLQYEIEPPKMLPKMREEYLRQIKPHELQQKKLQTAKLEEVVHKWEQHVAWWEKKFDYPPDFDYRTHKPTKDRSQTKGSSGGMMGGGGMGMGGMGMGGMGGGGNLREAPAGRGGMAGMGMGGMFGPPAAAPAAGMPAGLADPIASAIHRSPFDMQPRVALKPWDASAAAWYEYNHAGKKNWLAVYLKKREKQGNSPGFYLDNAQFFRLNHEPERAFVILSNLAELDRGNASMMRLLGQELLRLKYFDLAVLTFEEVLRLRPEEPQSYRDLAMALVERAKEAELQPAVLLAKRNGREADDAALAPVKNDYSRALDLLNQIITKQWNGKYENVELIALEEINAILPAAQKAGVREIPLDDRLIRLLEEDFRVVLTCDTDNAVSGLKISEPSAEQAERSHSETTIGGLVLGQVQNGGGLQQYAIHKAMHGKYTMHIVPSERSPEKSSLPTIVRVDVFTNFGRPNQTHKVEIIRLSGSSQRTKIVGKVNL